MWTKRRGVIAGGAVLLVLAIALIAVSTDNEGPQDPSRVLGVQFNSSTSTTTTSTTAPADTATTTTVAPTTTTVPPAPTTTVAPRPAAPPGTGTPPRPVQTTTTAPATARSERVLEPSDNRGTYTYVPGQPSTAGANPPNHPAGDRLRFLVYIDPPDAEDGIATVRVEMHNDSGRPIVFYEGGLVIRVFLTRDDGTQRTVEIRRPEISGLAVRESLELFQEYITEPGTYQFRAEAPVEYR